MQPIRTSVEVEEYRTRVEVEAYKTKVEIGFVGIESEYFYLHPAQVLQEDKEVAL